MSADVRRILVAQALRALIYGFGSVLLGASLEARGWSSARVGVLLAAIVAGTALLSLVVGTVGDRVGRRRLYCLLFLGLGASGAAFGLTDNFWLLCLVALTGTLSTEVVESGPFTSLEQAMLPSGLEPSAHARTFSMYNAIAALVGSAGALAAGGPAFLRNHWGNAPGDQHFFLMFVPVAAVGAAVAWSLSKNVEVGRSRTGGMVPLGTGRANALRLSGLFAVDSFGGGFIIQSFMAYWFRVKFDLSLETLGLLFFGVGLLQTVSFLLAARLAERIGLLNTMVFTHLPSNLLLAAIPLAPNLPVAVAFLLLRQSLSQMDVPTRQAYIARLFGPEERTAAAAYTNSARLIVRPLGPVLAGITQQVALGLPFFLGGGTKAVYDLALWSWFRHVPLEQEGDAPTSDRTAHRTGRRRI